MNQLAVTAGRNVRRLRRTRGITVADLAEAAKVSRATLTELEGGRGNPRIETLAALADALRVPPSELLTPTAGDVPVVVPRGVGPLLVRDTVTYRLLHRLVLGGGGVLETWEAQVLQGRHHSGPMPHGVLVSAYCASGDASVGPSDAPIALSVGDAVLYRADCATVFASDSQALLNLTVTYPPHAAGKALSAALTQGDNRSDP